jgi:hypothetical protein
MIWRHYQPELVEFVDSGMLFEVERDPVHQMHKHVEMDGMKNIWYDNSPRRDAFHIAEDAF